MLSANVIPASVFLTAPLTMMVIVKTMGAELVTGREIQSVEELKKGLRLRGSGSGRLLGRAY